MFRWTGGVFESVPVRISPGQILTGDPISNCPGLYKTVSPPSKTYYYDQINSKPWQKTQPGEILQWFDTL